MQPRGLPLHGAANSDPSGRKPCCSPAAAGAGEQTWPRPCNHGGGFVDQAAAQGRHLEGFVLPLLASHIGPPGGCAILAASPVLLRCAVVLEAALIAGCCPTFGVAFGLQREAIGYGGVWFGLLSCLEPVPHFAHRAVVMVRQEVLWFLWPLLYGPMAHFKTVLLRRQAGARCRCNTGVAAGILSLSPEYVKTAKCSGTPGTVFGHCTG